MNGCKTLCKTSNLKTGSRAFSQTTKTRNRWLAAGAVSQTETVWPWLLKSNREQDQFTLWLPKTSITTANPGLNNNLRDNNSNVIRPKEFDAKKKLHFKGLIVNESTAVTGFHAYLLKDHL